VAGPDPLPASDAADASAPAAADWDVVLPTTAPLGVTSHEAPPAGNQDSAGGESPLPAVVDDLVVTSTGATSAGVDVLTDLVPAAGGGETQDVEIPPAVVLERLDSGPRAAGGAPHEQRYTALRGLVRRSERDRLAAAMLLWEAREQRDHEHLDQTWPEYVSGAGLSKSAASKMLKAADVFRGQWLQLAQVDQADLNLERVYLASRLVTEQGLATMAALHEAVANPSHQLVAQLRGDEPADRCECTCPECGRKVNHIREVAS